MITRQSAPLSKKQALIDKFRANQINRDSTDKRQPFEHINIEIHDEALAWYDKKQGRTKE